MTVVSDEGGASDHGRAGTLPIQNLAKRELISETESGWPQIL